MSFFTNELELNRLVFRILQEAHKVKRFSHVMHITSEVEAKIDESMDAFDALRVVLPAGTLSGAPKIRAMQIIDELENSRRGCYGGAVCFINANGDLNSCITIRSAVLKEGVATVRAGGGIVYDSACLSGKSMFRFGIGASACP